MGERFRFRKDLGMVCVYVSGVMDVYRSGGVVVRDAVGYGDCRRGGGVVVGSWARVRHLPYRRHIGRRLLALGCGVGVGVSRSLGIWAGSAHRLLGGVGVGVSSPLGICAGSAHRLLSDLGEETCVLLGDSGVVAGGFVAAVVATLAQFRHLP